MLERQSSDSSFFQMDLRKQWKSGAWRAGKAARIHLYKKALWLENGVHIVFYLRRKHETTSPQASLCSKEKSYQIAAVRHLLDGGLPSCVGLSMVYACSAEAQEAYV